MANNQDTAHVDKIQSQKALNAAYRGYKDGSVEFFGNQIEALTGYSKDDFNSKRLRWIDVISEMDRESVKQSFVHGLKGDKTYMREYRVQHRDGSLVWFQEWGQIICDPTGQVESVLGVILEITERKRMEEAQLRIDRLTGKYLLFVLGSEQFAISIMKVREIIGWISITSIPRTPDYLLGVINLRGRVIPVVNLRLKLGMEDCPPTDRTCIVLVESQDKNGTRMVGLTVDAVSEVVHVQGQDIDESPDIITRFNGDYIMGMAKLAGGIKIVLEVDRLNLGIDLSQLEHSA
jgi:purine-binding chemotaxis protein CheW